MPMWSFRDGGYFNIVWQHHNHTIKASAVESPLEFLKLICRHCSLGANKHCLALFDAQCLKLFEYLAHRNLAVAIGLTALPHPSSGSGVQAQNPRLEARRG